MPLCAFKVIQGRWWRYHWKAHHSRYICAIATIHLSAMVYTL